MFYFNPIPNTPEQVRQQYRGLARRYHPDMRGGSAEAMIIINAEYEQVTAFLRGNKGQTPINEQKPSESEIIEQLLEKLRSMGMKNVTIECDGKRIRVKGDTYPHRESLGRYGLGLYWAPGHKEWTFPSIFS